MSNSPTTETTTMATSTYTYREIPAAIHWNVNNTTACGATKARAAQRVSACRALIITEYAYEVNCGKCYRNASYKLAMADVVSEINRKADAEFEILAASLRRAFSTFTRADALPNIIRWADQKRVDRDRLVAAVLGA